MALDLGKIAIALGGLLAYQNRDKIGDLLRGNSDPNAPQKSGGGMLESVLGGSAGSGLQDILDRFRGAGSEKEVDSWVSKEPNHPLQPHQVESAIDAETLDQLSKQTGLSRQELIERITRDLPKAVDSLTPDGKLPEKPKSGPWADTLLDDVPRSS